MGSKRGRGAPPVRWAFGAMMHDGVLFAHMSAEPMTAAAHREHSRFGTLHTVSRVTVPLSELAHNELRRVLAALGGRAAPSLSNDLLMVEIAARVQNGPVPVLPVVEPEPQPDPEPEPEPEPEWDGVHRDFHKTLARAQMDNLWLWGEPGVGKTTLAWQIAKHLGRDFYLIPISGDMTKYDFLGFRDGAGHVAPTDFRRGFESPSVILIDEASSMRPNLAGVLNGALDNGVMGCPDGQVYRHPECIIIAAANDTGRGPTRECPKGLLQDASTMDRYTLQRMVLDERIVEAGVAERLQSQDQRDYLMAVWRQCRINVKHYNLHDVLITPRAAFKMANLLELGEPMRDAVTDCILKGIDGEPARKVLEDTGITL